MLKYPVSIYLLMSFSKKETDFINFAKSHGLVCDRAYFDHLGYCSGQNTDSLVPHCLDDRNPCLIRCYFGNNFFINGSDFKKMCPKLNQTDKKPDLPALRRVDNIESYDL